MGDPKEFVIDQELMRKCVEKMDWFKYEILKKISRLLHHGDWGSLQVSELFDSVKEEVEELKHRVDQSEVQSVVYGPQFLPYLFMMIDECCDVAFSAMMLADVCNERIKLIIQNNDSQPV